MMCGPEQIWRNHYLKSQDTRPLSQSEMVLQSTIPSNHGTRLYHFRLVRQNDALSHFCFWVLGQTSISCMSDANLVREVQTEWKSLLLALNGLIGSYGEPLVTWKNARKKLSKELLSNCHTGGLPRCLETSIDFLDDVAKVWFSDLARFPDEKKNCEDASLDIWVYIQKLKRENALVMVLELALKNLVKDNPGNRAAVSYGSASELYFSQKYVMRDAPHDIWVYILKLKWKDALVMVLELPLKNLFNLRDNLGSRAGVSNGSASELYFSQKYVMRDAPLDIWVYILKLKRQDAPVIVLEFTRKNLFNLRDNPGSRAAISYGSASKLYFSQQDVMQGLALYMRCQRSLVHKKRLIMLRKKHSLQGKWELLNRKAFQAQVVSVHTDLINETQCLEMNFSVTEALVYSTTVVKDERLRFL